MNLYWLVELDEANTAIRTLAVVGEDGDHRTYRMLTEHSPDPVALPDRPAMAVNVDVVVPWSGHRLSLLPVAAPPLTGDLDEAVAFLAERIAASMTEVY